MENLRIAKSKEWIALLPKMANRHGLIAGATGTGKTVTLQRMVEGFSRIGVPVFVADVKGDLSGVAAPGQENSRVSDRVRQLAMDDFKFSANPAVFWDLLGEQGIPVRTTVSEMGPLLLSRLLNLNETQEGVLALAFKIADDHGLLLLDLKDLTSLLQFVGDNARQFTTQYGNVSAASIGAVQRGLLALDQQGASHFFGEPALNPEDLLQTDGDGLGVVNVLAADKLMQSPKLYATFLLWLLSELFEKMPEVGDRDKPKLVFFFDEAHLLFDDPPEALLDKVEQVVRLIRSKGVGVYFISQNPLDIPPKILGQLGNRVQHAMRAFTPQDQKTVRAAAQTFRSNPDLDIEKAITELAVGEALVSFLDETGSPGVVQRALVAPPQSRIGPLAAQERQEMIRQSFLRERYAANVDRESAYEVLKKRATETQRQTAESAPARSGPNEKNEVTELMGAFAKSAARSIGSQVGREIIRGVLGSIFGGTPRRR